MKDMRCPKCGSVITITNDATAFHVGCPSRGTRDKAPQYQEVK